MKLEISTVNVISADYKSTTDFWINLQVGISERTGFGAEVINVDVVSFERLKSLVEAEPVTGRGKVFVSMFEEKEIEQILNNIIDGLDAESWDDLLVGLGKYFDFL